MGSKQRQPSRPRTSVAAMVATTVLLLAGGAVLAACGSSTSGGAPAAAHAATPAAASSAATPATNASPVAAEAFRGMLPIVFTQSLITTRPYRSTKTVGGVVQLRHAVWSYQHASSDSRLTGRLDVVINVDQRPGDKSAVLWGTGLLRNAGGAWVQKWTGGIAAGGDVHHVYGTFKGTGGYAGLVAHESGWFAEAGQGFTPDIQVVGAGWIEASDGSQVPPAPGPGATPVGWTPVVGIATTRQTAYAGGTWVWDLEQSDPRLSGRLEGAVEPIGSPRPDGSQDYRASNTLASQDGAWATPAGPVDVRGPGPRFEHFMYWMSKGSGAYAGLTYHGFWRFMEPHDIVPGDKFVYTGWITEAK